jgi:hypothetical protein
VIIKSDKILSQNIGKARKRNTKPILTPKISCGFWTKLGNFGNTWSDHFLKKLNVKNEGNNLGSITLLNIKKLQPLIPWDL